jgi:hypothetical protein
VSSKQSGFEFQRRIRNLKLLTAHRLPPAYILSAFALNLAFTTSFKEGQKDE